MADFKPILTTHNHINTTDIPIEQGQLIFSTDDANFYVDGLLGSRLKLNIYSYYLDENNVQKGIITDSVNIASGAYSYAEGYTTRALGDYSHVEGNSNRAIGDCSHAEGNNTQSIGDYSHAEGDSTIANSYYAHAEGYGTRAIESKSHAEGSNSQALGVASHAEGYSSQAVGEASHAEGQGTRAAESNSHAEGRGSQAVGLTAHAEGYETFADGYSHAEGYQTAAGTNNTSSAYTAHAEGRGSKAIGQYSHAEGYETMTAGSSSHVEGYQNYIDDHGQQSHGEGVGCAITGGPSASHIEGTANITVGVENSSSFSSSHNEGQQNVLVYGNVTHVEGERNYSKGANNHAEGYLNCVGAETTTINKNVHDTQTQYTQFTHVEGNDNFVNGYFSHIEGKSNIVQGNCQHGEGYHNLVIGAHNHAEGYFNKVGRIDGAYSTIYENVPYAEEEKVTVPRGSGTTQYTISPSKKILDGLYNCYQFYTPVRFSHAQGFRTTAAGYNAFSSGAMTEANGDCSYSTGRYNIVNGHDASVFGRGNEANCHSSMVLGQYSDTASITETDLLDLNAIVLNQFLKDNGSIQAYSTVDCMTTDYIDITGYKDLKLYVRPANLDDDINTGYITVCFYSADDYGGQWEQRYHMSFVDETSSSFDYDNLHDYTMSGMETLVQYSGKKYIYKQTTTYETIYIKVPEKANYVRISCALDPQDVSERETIYIKGYRNPSGELLIVGNGQDSTHRSNILEVTPSYVNINGNLKINNLDITNGGNSQVNVMPTAAAGYVDVVYQYVGETTANYINGYFYKCIENNGTYSWQVLKVQEDIEGQTIQVDLLPTPNYDQLNKIYQYTGTTANDYINGHFYKCIYKNNAYIWEHIYVQDKGIDYNTTEQDTTFKWIDGKTIYQKTVTIYNNGILASGMTNVDNVITGALPSGIDTIIKYDCIVKSVISSTDYYLNQNEYIFRVRADYLGVYYSNVNITKDLIVTYQYTKA